MLVALLFFGQIMQIMPFIPIIPPFWIMLLKRIASKSKNTVSDKNPLVYKKETPQNYPMKLK